MPWNETEVNVAEFNYGITKFDNVIYSFISVFQCLTGEGWSFLMYLLWHTFSKPLVALYFVFLILFGVFFVLNLFLAVIKNNFEKEN